MKRFWPFVVASALCVPVSVYALLCLLAFGCSVSGAGIPYALVGPTLEWLLFLSSWQLALPILAIVSVSVGVLWHRAKARFEVVFAGIYSLAVLINVGFLVWCLLIRPELAL